MEIWRYGDMKVWRLEPDAPVIVATGGVVSQVGMIGPERGLLIQAFISDSDRAKPCILGGERVQFRPGEEAGIIDLTWIGT